MEHSLNTPELHPQFLEMLFAFKSKVSKTFKEVLGIHEIHHLAITRVDKNNQLLSLSSTPSMEFNLFNSSLWLYDKTYNPLWFHLKTQDYWQSLYQTDRYDELYYLKQIKHSLPIGLSMAASVDNNYIIYSLASNNSCSYTQELFTSQQEDFYKIGQYCFNILLPLFTRCDDLALEQELTRGLL